MKYIYAAFLMVCAVVLSAQVTYLTENISEGAQPAYSIILKDVDTKFVDSQWKTYIRKYGGKYKYNRKLKEHTNTNTSLSSVSSQALDAYALTRSAGNNTQFVLLLKEGDSFIDWEKDSTKADNIANLLTHFSRDVAREALREKIKDEEKNLSQLQRAKNKLERDNEKLHNSIKSHEEKIAKAKEDIENNVQEQESNQTAIDQQLEKVEELKKKLGKM